MEFHSHDITIASVSSYAPKVLFVDFGPLRRRLVEYFVAQQCWPVFSAWADKREGKKKKGNVGHITEEKKNV